MHLLGCALHKLTMYVNYENGCSSFDWKCVKIVFCYALLCINVLIRHPSLKMQHVCLFAFVVLVCQIDHFKGELKGNFK